MAGEQDIVQRLSRLDTCAVSAVLDQESRMAAETRKGRSGTEVMGLSYVSMLKDGGEK